MVAHTKARKVCEKDTQAHVHRFMQKSTRLALVVLPTAEKLFCSFARIYTQEAHLLMLITPGPLIVWIERSWGWLRMYN
jgi:hypothetical protein